MSEVCTLTIENNSNQQKQTKLLINAYQFSLKLRLACSDFHLIISFQASKISERKNEKSDCDWRRSERTQLCRENR